MITIDEVGTNGNNCGMVARWWHVGGTLVRL